VLEYLNDALLELIIFDDLLFKVSGGDLFDPGLLLHLLRLVEMVDVII